MELTTTSIAPRHGPRAPSRRAFRHAGQLPSAPVGAEILAAVAHARAHAGREHAWDARLEASLLATHGYLWRRGRGEKWAGAQGSSRYACSIAQLVMGLAPIMGWRGIPDTRDHAARRRFIKAHRKSVQRWLAWLELSGLITHTPQQDEEGFWWRTIIELHPTPALDPELLSSARRRRLSWRAAEQRRGARGRRRDLTAILQRARLTRAQRRARAYQRRRQLRACQQLTRVRELIAHSLADHASEHLTHPYGASTTCRKLPNADLPPRTLVRGPTRTHAKVPAANPATATVLKSASNTAPEVGEEQRWAIYQAVMAVRYSRPDSAWEIPAAATQQRVAELRQWPVGRPCPRWRLIEAWALEAHGLFMAVAGATRLAMWSEQRPAHGARLDRALARYTRVCEARPAGWPVSPIAAFIDFLSLGTRPQDGPARAMAYDVARFDEMTKQMSAYAHLTAAQHAARAQARARRRVARTLAEQTTDRLQLRFRTSDAARVQIARDLLDSDHPAHQAAGRTLYAAQQRRQTAERRDALVSAGQDPWPHDGRYRAAVRYAQRWNKPAPDWNPAGK